MNLKLENLANIVYVLMSHKAVKFGKFFGAVVCTIDVLSVCTIDVLSLFQG